MGGDGKPPEDVSPGGVTFAAFAVVIGGLVAATIDIGAACLITGRDVIFILHSIAGGLLAKASFSGGFATAALGLVLQELMGMIIALVYGLAVRLRPAIAQTWVLSGAVYGVGVFIVMDYVVVPLSAWRTFPHFKALTFAENLAAMLVFGLIIAGFARRPEPTLHR